MVPLEKLNNPLIPVLSQNRLIKKYHYTVRHTISKLNPRADQTSFLRYPKRHAKPRRTKKKNKIVMVIFAKLTGPTGSVDSYAGNLISIP